MLNPMFKQIFTIKKKKKGIFFFFFLEQISSCIGRVFNFHLPLFILVISTNIYKTTEKKEEKKWIAKETITYWEKFTLFWSSKDKKINNTNCYFENLLYSLKKKQQQQKAVEKLKSYKVAKQYWASKQTDLTAEYLNQWLFQMPAPQKHSLIYSPSCSKN